jgi:hypothetical protein
MSREGRLALVKNEADEVDVDEVGKRITRGGSGAVPVSSGITGSWIGGTGTVVRAAPGAETVTALMP